jgi:hypothetical protein
MLFVRILWKNTIGDNKAQLNENLLGVTEILQHIF